MDQLAHNNNDDAVVLPDDLGGGGAGDGTYCSEHPYRNNLGGGICAFCLQEKLGKLVSSTSSLSFPIPVRNSPLSPGSDSSSPPSSDLSFSSSSSKPPNLDSSRYNRQRNVHASRAKIPGFLYSKKKNKKCTPSSASSDRAAEFASFKRSNTAPRRHGHQGGFLDGGHGDVLAYSPRKKGFWSFVYLSGTGQPSSSSTSITSAASRHPNGAPNATLSSSSSVVISGRRTERMIPFSDGSQRCADVIPEDDDIDRSNNFESKVSRSRSVGCGSRSFSGDFFERISTGFGDCTLRRVESQREPNCHGHGHGHPLGPIKPRASSANPEYCMKDRVRCGGIFGGFMMASSSSYRITSPSSDDPRPNGFRPSAASGAVIHRKYRSWGWAFASPMRAFSKPSSKDGKSATPNLAAIPSLLTVGG